MISAGMRLVLQTVKDLDPATFENIQIVIGKQMCERILGSHLTRLKAKGWLSYDLVMYAYDVTEAGEEALNDGD